MFKKKKINSKKKNTKIINYIGMIMIFLVFVLGFFAISYAKKIDFLGNIKKEKLEKQEIKSKTKEEIKKKLEDENKINILLLGRGGLRNDAPDLTDSIILASVNKKTKTISMFSIPRDLYVKYKNGKSGKINKAYAVSKAKKGSIEAGLDAIKYNIEALTGEKVDFYVNIDFNGFVKFIDAIGGIEITVPKTLVDTKYPDNNWGYRTFIIKKGTWNFTGEEALGYARSRHSTSDFDRSIRQQQIIKSVKSKLTEGGFFEKISKAKKAYDVFKKYVLTDIGLSDAIDIFNEIKDKDYKIISSNLNDSCFEGDPFCKKGGFLYTPEREMYGGASVLLVNGSGIGNFNNYKTIEKYIDLVFNNPSIYKENINISVLNSTKVPLLAGNLAFEFRRYGFNIPNNNKSIFSLKKKSFVNSIINYSSDIKNSETLKYLKNIFKNVEFREVKDLEYAKVSEAKIEIIIGDDYKKIYKDLENNL